MSGRTPWSEIVHKRFENCRLEGDFTLSSGKKSQYFYDFTLLSPLELTQHCKALKETIELNKIQFDYIVSPARGGIIPGFIIADLFNCPLMVIEKDNKTSLYAGGRKYDSVDNKLRYLIVDDVVSTYSTVDRIILNMPGDHGKTEPGGPVGVASFIFRGEKVRDFPTIFLTRKEIEK